MKEKNKSKILIFDLETLGVNALRSDLGHVMVMGYKWYGEKKVYSLRLTAEDLWRKDLKFDRNLLIEASKIFEQADLLVGHFASVFDRRFFQGRLLVYNLKPIPSTKLIDTCLETRKIANFSSNRLKRLCHVLNLRHKKLESKFPDWWLKVMILHDMQTLKTIDKYCKGDVLCTEELYDRIKPHIKIHPRMITYDRSTCALCGGDVEYRGYYRALTHSYRRFKCKSCGHWDHSTKAEKVNETIK